jgi:hypothetical protein
MPSASGAAGWRGADGPATGASPSTNSLAFALFLRPTYTSAVALKRQAMFQIVESFVDTITKFIDAHGLKVVIGAAVIVGVGAVLTVLRRVVVGRGSQQG